MPSVIWKLSPKLFKSFLSVQTLHSYTEDELYDCLLNKIIWQVILDGAMIQQIKKGTTVTRQLTLQFYNNKCSFKIFQIMLYKYTLQYQYLQY